MSETTRIPNNILSQLADCLLSPGVWSGCPPDRYTDPDLQFMLAQRLVVWGGPRQLGYYVTPQGEAVLAAAAQWKVNGPQWRPYRRAAA